ncbi:hypothetical protein J2W49_001901 [Hydrogenophaga palleronii]|uniref:Uncharacterized protein n=1 Tax=Hydrogenophaga palleronii TaxID=65655 RepID=A0ABU1WKX4_9BURK|nr:type III secretion HpaP family protein [Hydrogenophaga palleronii]MDR7149946.1 hypothetical protein [Hydrogenophaga palleronii]
MSRTEGRRPLRVLSAEEVAQHLQAQAQAPRGAVQLAVAQSTDRFRRSLSGPPRRADSLCATPSPPPLQASAGRGRERAPAPPAMPGPLAPFHTGAEALLDRPDGEDHLGVDQTAARGSQEAVPSGCTPSTDASNRGGVNDGLVVSALPQDPWPQQMAQTIATLCARAEPSFVNWTVTLPMDPQGLPQTDLRLSLSQHWLSLRFITQSPQSHHLVCAHRDRLLEELERLPQLPHGIDIEVT